MFKKSNDTTNPNNNTCDTIGISYKEKIKPILESRCFNCHQTSICASRGGNVCFETHAQVKTWIGNGYIIPNIEHKPGYSPMPKSSGKLSACEIALIRNWANEGAKDN